MTPPLSDGGTRMSATTVRRVKLDLEEVAQRMCGAGEFWPEAVVREASQIIADLETSLASATRALEAAQQDVKRLDWLEAHGYALMCWNVSDDLAVEHWAAPMKPNNGWTVSTNHDEDDNIGEPAGDTARDAIDWAIKLELSGVSLPESGE